MAYFYRLIVGLFVSLFVCAGSAHAAFPASPVFSCNAGGAGRAHVTASASTRLACAEALYALGLSQGWTAPGQCVSESGWFLTCGSSGSQVNQGGVTSYSCPSNASLSGASCSCSSGYAEQASSCVVDEPPNPCSNFGQLLSSYHGSVQMVKGQTSACMGGCEVNFKSGYQGADLYGAGSDGVMRGWVPIGQLQSADAVGTCGTPTAPVVEPVPDAELPPPGTCPGTVNGIAVNVPCSSTETNNTSTSQETDGAGNTTSKTVAKSTSCNAAGACTTTVTTTTTVNGSSSIATKSTTQSKGEFCAGNPGSKECGDGEGSSFGGSCGAGFVCDGDALQCAMAKEQHKRACELFQTDSDERQSYETAKSKGQAGTDQTGDLPGNQTVNVGPGDFDSSDAIGGAQCITDKSIVVFGRTINMPLSRTCPYLAYLGQLLVVVGYLLGARILIRG